VVYVIDDSHSCLSRRIAFLGINQVCDLKVHGKIGLEVFGAAGLLDVSLEG
jgi:hypothetical protein